MRALVLPLRHAGIELPERRPESDWIDGHLLMTRGKSTRGEVLVLQLSLVGMHAPDRAGKMQLLEPRWVALGGDEMTVRGLEVTRNRAVVMQEWLIDIRGTRRRKVGPPTGEIKSARPAAAPSPEPGSPVTPVQPRTLPRA